MTDISWWRTSVGANLGRYGLALLALLFWFIKRWLLSIDTVSRLIRKENFLPQALP